MGLQFATMPQQLVNIIVDEYQWYENACAISHFCVSARGTSARVMAKSVSDLQDSDLLVSLLRLRASQQDKNM